MIITVGTKKEADLAAKMLKRAGYEYNGISYYYSQEWTKKDDVILLHKQEYRPKPAVEW